MFFLLVVARCFSLYYFITIIIIITTTIHFMLEKRETYFQIFCMHERNDNKDDFD